MDKSTRIRIRIDGREVELEGSAEHIALVISHLLSAGGPKMTAEIAQRTSPLTSAGEQKERIIDIREFFRDKQPASDVEAAAAVAYYYQFVAPASERRETLDPDFLQEALRLASYELPARPSMTLVHAKDAGYLSAGADRGQYRLTTVGHNLVAHRMGKERALTPKATRTSRNTKRRRPSSRKTR
jgi:hypothetical protein